MYSKDFTCVLLVLHSKECSLEAFTIQLPSGCSNTSFMKREYEKSVGSRSELSLVLTDVLNVENTEKFHSVSVACLLPFLLQVLLSFTCFASEPHRVSYRIFPSLGSCSPNCEVINKAMSKGEVKKEVNAWKKHEDKQ